MAETALHEVAPPAPVLAAPDPLASQLAVAWLTALAGDGDTFAGQSGTPMADPLAAKRALAELSRRLITVLMEPQFQPRRAAAVGRALVSADFTSADVLGCTLRVLIVLLPALIRGSAPARLPGVIPADLEHRIAAVTEALANGYVRALRDRTLAEQESIRRAELDAERILSAQLRYQATHDPLTGLSNRAAVLGALSAALAADAKGRVGLSYLDLDGFKAVNDRHGHGAGDQLLVTVSERISRVAAQHGVLAARIGGDEFMVLADTSPGLHGMIALVTDILGEISQPVPLRVGSVSVSACAGIADREAVDTTAEAMVSDADAALYEAKSRGAGRWSVRAPSPLLA
ncbi:MAG: diguanylate cyclase domain-containing protein [Trebonia sp.]